MLLYVDVDECEMKLDNCHSKANCTNIHGGFTCECISGFTGNGSLCDGKSNIVIICFCFYVEFTLPNKVNYTLL